MAAYPDRTNLPIDACLVLTTDPKPRHRWTSELHERFVDAVSQLGGPDKGTPKTIMRTMGVKGLTLYHVKSHLQNFRLGRSCKESVDNSKDVSCVAESQGCGSSSTSSLRMAAQEQNEYGYRSCQVTAALRVQMEVQRRLHEQLEVQKRLQLRIEAQGKYLQSILEKACKAIEEQALAFAGLEVAREELSELAIKVSNRCQGTTSTFNTTKITIPSLPELAVAIGHKNNCSAESSLTSSTVVSPISSALMKKRHRGVFGNGDGAVVGHEAGWVMPNSSIG